jgi:hypothetical protein
LRPNFTIMRLFCQSSMSLLMIGTTRSRVSYFMNKFRKLGLIDYNGHIEVHDSLLNTVLHDKPQLKLDENGPSRVGLKNLWDRANLNSARYRLR